ncbi:hypothetical protein [Citrobacter werkmanii]|uniref:hypothetical protein n=1 Tax=Citrobacter werkmanii TaxID=67827 RepID=UPI0005078D1E|nr:hypothetical protein [Citrobacter werkmanii]UCA26016.1 hypothetical protein LA356_04640 [Citrobacter werkmanii]GAL43009.1 hypothetical protein CIWKM_02_00530 [Citrobacter werkmanii NBRC 105721]
MTMFNEAELIRQLEEQRSVIVLRDSEISRLQGEVELLAEALKNTPPAQTERDYLGRKK